MSDDSGCFRRRNANLKRENAYVIISIKQTLRLFAAVR